MVCPYCDVNEHPRRVHIHLVEKHADRIVTGFEDSRARMFYRVECPHCRTKLEKTVKPRYKDPEFLQEFDREIKLVAFDMLLNHIEAMHIESEQADDS